MRGSGRRDNRWPAAILVIAAVLTARFLEFRGGGGQTATGDPMTADDGTTIESNRPSLLAVTSRFNIKIW